MAWTRPFTADNPWFDRVAELVLCQLGELLGTKLRTLYQRKKGRDLYDLWFALGTADLRGDRVVDCFQRYIVYDGVSVPPATRGLEVKSERESVPVETPP